MSDTWIRAAHFIAIILMASSLFAEHLLLRREMAADQIRRLARIDMMYGVCATAVAVFGAILWLGGVGKPASFYSANPVFHTKLGLFVFIALISIYPTVFFMRHRRSQATCVVVPGSVLWVVRAELALLLALPVLAALMAKGVGLAR
jgi:putative membrane protein